MLSLHFDEINWCYLVVDGDCRFSPLSSHHRPAPNSEFILVNRSGSADLVSKQLNEGAFCVLGAKTKLRAWGVTSVMGRVGRFGVYSGDNGGTVEQVDTGTPSPPVAAEGTPIPKQTFVTNRSKTPGLWRVADASRG